MKQKILWDYLSWPVYLVSETTSVTRVAVEMLDKKVSGVIVQDNLGRMKGIVTTDDIWLSLNVLQCTECKTQIHGKFWLRENIKGENFKTEAPADLNERHSNLTSANNSDGFSMKIKTDQNYQREVSFSDPVISFMNFSVQTEKKSYCKLIDGLKWIFQKSLNFKIESFRRIQINMVGPADCKAISSVPVRASVSRNSSFGLSFTGTNCLETRC